MNILQLLRTAFFPKRHSDKYLYLGYTLNPYDENDHPVRHKIIEEFIEQIDEDVLEDTNQPRWLLRLLYLIAHGKSVVAVKNRRVSDFLNNLMGGIRINDIKTKWDINDIRIYGQFTDTIDEYVKSVENEINKLPIKVSK